MRSVGERGVEHHADQSGYEYGGGNKRLFFTIDQTVGIDQSFPYGDEEVEAFHNGVDGFEYL